MLTTRRFAACILAASALVLVTALMSQYWGGLRPCELCLLQRWPWTIAITISLVALLAGGRRGVLPWLALALGAVFAVSAAFAFYHVGVEQHWFAGPSACTATGGGNPAAMTLDEMKRQILGTAPVLCDQVQWSLFGVSLAGWNLLASLAMAALCGVVFVRTRRRAARSAVPA
ncbi:MAG: disulfide bond formation protein B [Thiohalocapsa sp.]